MSKHIVDKSHTTRDADRLAEYTRLERKLFGKIRPQTEKLRRTPQELDETERLRRYLDMDRAQS